MKPQRFTLTNRKLAIGALLAAGLVAVVALWPRHDRSGQDRFAPASMPPPVTRTVVPPSVVERNSAALRAVLRSDMTDGSEAAPHGVPRAYGWGNRPRRGNRTSARGFKAFTAWGQLYRCGRENPPRAEVQIRRLTSYSLGRGEPAWRLMQRTSAVNGAAYPEDFQGSPGRANLLGRSESLTAVRLTRNSNFHFFPPSRVALDADTTTGVIVSLEARLAPGSPTGCLVMSAGGDWWRSVDAPYRGGTTTTDAGIGRFKRVTRAWRIFTMSSADANVAASTFLPRVALPDEARAK